jgi:tetratricopeptide (TPR) repeat protein
MPPKLRVQYFDQILIALGVEISSDSGLQDSIRKYQNSTLRVIYVKCLALIETGDPSCFTDAENLVLHVLKICDFLEIQGEYCASLWGMRAMINSTYRADYDEALDNCETGLAMCEDALGSKAQHHTVNHTGVTWRLHRKMADLLDLRGMAYFNLMRWDQAEADCNQALELYLGMLDAGNPRTIATMRHLAMIAQHSSKDISRSCSLYRKALNLCLDILGQKHSLTAKLYRDLGHLFSSELKDYKQAMACLQAARDAFISIGSDTSYDTAMCLHYAAEAHANIAGDISLASKPRQQMPSTATIGTSNNNIPTADIKHDMCQFKMRIKDSDEWVADGQLCIVSADCFEMLVHGLEEQLQLVEVEIEIFDSDFKEWCGIDFIDIESLPLASTIRLKTAKAKENTTAASVSGPPDPDVRDQSQALSVHAFSCELDVAQNPPDHFDIAVTLYKQAIAMLEAVLGQKHPEVAAVNNMARPLL